MPVVTIKQVRISVKAFMVYGRLSMLGSCCTCETVYGEGQKLPVNGADLSFARKCNRQILTLPIGDSSDMAESGMLGGPGPGALP